MREMNEKADMEEGGDIVIELEKEEGKWFKVIHSSNLRKPSENLTTLKDVFLNILAPAHIGDKTFVVLSISSGS